MFEVAPGFDAFGITAFTTTRQAGDFNLASVEPVGVVLGRWLALGTIVDRAPDRIGCARQVHGSVIVEHLATWSGFLRGWDADGHFSTAAKTAMAVTLADCVPVFIGHPSGAAAILHSGWKGTVANITEAGLRRFTSRGFDPKDIVMHCGPAICGRCYEVGADVFRALTGRQGSGRGRIDLRTIIADQARALGVQAISISPSCTRCDNDRFFSHRCGDTARQLGVIITG